MVEDNTIFIGKKPLMSYVLAAIRQINDNDGTVVIKARGKAISRAVDVAEILRNQFVTTANVDDIEISTERLTSEEGRESNVSSIEIFMSTPEGSVPVEVPGRSRGSRGPRDRSHGGAPAGKPRDRSGERSEERSEEKAEEKVDDGTDFFGEFADQS